MRDEFSSVLRVASSNKSARAFPERTDSRFRRGSLFPAVKPKFKLSFGKNCTVFTIGSCFARNMEEVLSQFQVTLPTRSFSVPKSEFPNRPNGLLNEYNPGAMSQRIMFALQGRRMPEPTIVPTETGFTDLTLAGGADVSFERALQRREEIDAVYRRLPQSTIVIITLGFVEAWFDLECAVYLNRMPPLVFAKNHPGRFEFRRMDVDDSHPLIEQALGALCDLGIKVILTISPVPIQTTFTSTDCVTANEFSKAVLRVCAEKLEKRFANVDYFPSYEIVRSGGLWNYVDDNAHVKDEVVREVVKYMMEHYCEPAPLASDQRSGN